MWSISMKRQSFVLPTLILLLWQVAATAQTSHTTDADISRRRLESEITRLAKSAGGTLGIRAINVESGRTISFNGSERFPMASTYKVPIAIQLLSRVDRGEVKLDQMVELKPSDIRPNGTIRSLLSKPGLSLSVRNLLELVL